MASKSLGSQSPFDFNEYEKHGYFNIKNGEFFGNSSLKSLQKHILEIVQRQKKAIIALPPYFRLKSWCRDSFFEFLEREAKGSYLFVPSQEGVQWGGEWKGILEKGLPVADEEKALIWVKDTITEGNVSSYKIEDVVYIRCYGDFKSFSLLENQIEEAIETTPLKGELQLPLTSVFFDFFISWTFLRKALVIDLANVFLLNRLFLKRLSDILGKHDLNPGSQGVYFVTFDLFQSWLLKQGTGISNIKEAGNIIRVFPEKDADFDCIVKLEAQSIAKISMRQSHEIAFFVHQVNGPSKALQVMRRFYPEFVICEKQSDAREIRENMDRKKREKVLHMTLPYDDPSIMILSPSIISQVYDIKLFAEHALARYKNKRGYPNETFIYSFDSFPENTLKVVLFMRMEFSYVFEESHNILFDTLEKCETASGHQGCFVISLFKDKILNLDLDLTFTEKGFGDFIINYPKIFPNHFSVLCNSLRLFVKNEPSEKTASVKLNPVTGYNEIIIKQEGFVIEVTIEEESTTLTVKSSPHKDLERRCFNLFSLMSASNIFNQLLNKEILIDIVSLLCDNSNQSTSDSKCVFFITFTASPNGSKLQLFESEHNRMLLKEEIKGGRSYIQLSGQVPFYSTTMKRFFKPIYLFFMTYDMGKKEDEAEKLWGSACCEAISLFGVKVEKGQSLYFDFRIEGDSWSCVFISNAREGNPISPQSLANLQKGADKVEVLNEGRKILLLKNPVGGENGSLVDSELDEVNESVMLKEIEDAKALKQTEISSRLQDIYSKAYEELKDKEIEDVEGEEVQYKQSEEGKHEGSNYSGDREFPKYRRGRVERILSGAKNLFSLSGPEHKKGPGGIPAYYWQKVRLHYERGEDIERASAVTGFSYEGVNEQGYLEYKDNETGIFMVLIPSGNFIMGSSKEEIDYWVKKTEDEEYRDEGPEHPVYLDAYLIGKYEVTQEEWKKVIDIQLSYKDKDNKSPVENVSWYDCQSFCGKIGLSLPTEAQWERACRAGSRTRFYWGNEINEDYCWYKKNSKGVTKPVGKKKPNGFGLYDMIGNLWEWCYDWYSEDYYKKSRRKNPSGPEKGTERVYRGGCYWSPSMYCRSAYRNGFKPQVRWQNMGFRICCKLRE